MLDFRPKLHNTIAAAMVITAVLLSYAFSIAGKADDPIDKLVAALQKWSAANPQEKVYLHLDKPYYTLGDTIWFKGYVTIGSRHQMSAMSGALYVDLINEQDSVVRNLKLPITTGMAMGDIILGDDLKEGNYRVRSYTQWMRNAGEAYYFDKTITLGSVINDGIVTRADYQYKNNDGKQTLVATLNYTDGQGQPITGKDIMYRVVVNKKVVWSKSGKTDANGNIPVSIANQGDADLAGAYIRTTLTNSGNKEVTKDFPIKASLSQSDVQFFPEGSNLINNATSKIAFKATGVDGLGISISGKVIEVESNKEVGTFSTTNAGMGSFVLRPEVGKSYAAQVTFDDKSTKTIPLPKSNDAGYTLNVYQPGKDSILVRINTSEKQLEQLKQNPATQSVNLIARSGEEVIFASNLRIERPMSSVWLDKKAFPSGIAQFTLFNFAGEPVNERIAFIKSNDRLALDLKPHKAAYKSKEQVIIRLSAKDGDGKSTAGNFSVSVIDESKIPSDEANETSIFSSLLLSSDIKGYIEKPNHYFIDDNELTNKALDDLMLTQGYRKFVWKELSKTDTAAISSAPLFPVEGLGVTISGKVQSLGHKPTPDATVTLLSTRAKITKFATSDAEGRFKFDGIFLTDSIKFAIQARTKKGSDKLEVILDSIPSQNVSKNPNMADLSTNITGTLKAYIEAGKKQDEINIKLGRMDRVHTLREVNIRGAKEKQETLAPQGMLQIVPGTASRTFTPKESENNASLLIYLMGRLNGVKYRTYKPPLKPEIFNYPMVQYDLPDPEKVDGYVPLPVILNGRLLDNTDEAPDAFDNTLVDINDIARIDFVVNSPAVTSKLTKYPAALLIYTKKADQRKIFTPSLVNIMPKGFNKAREFYSPKYDRPGSGKQLPDMRTTIYWDPYLKTYAAGQGSFNFFTGDGPATYRVTVEGINSDGQLGRKVFRYTVDGEMADGSAVSALSNMDHTQNAIAAAMDTMRKRLPMEKVYLHTDKPYYNIGDTLWFKGYVTDADGKPSRQSGLLYVELDNDSTEAVRRVSLKIKDGMVTGQIPLIKAIFQEGGYTLRAYTNWMQNFGESHVFNQRFYLGVPATDAWLVRSSAGILSEGDKDKLDVELKLNRADKGLSSLALRKVEVKIYEGKYYLHKEEMQTGVDGSIKFSKVLKDKLDGRNLRVQITSLDPQDKNKVIQVPLRINRSKKTDLQFLPEGGNLVAGLKALVGFKAIGEDGKGTPIAAELLDSKGNRVTDFTTLYKGMGSFEFTPKVGESYTAKIIIQPEGIGQAYALPTVHAQGTVMHVDNGDDIASDIKVSVLASSNIVESADSAYYLIGTQGGRIYYSQKIELNKPAVSIPKKDIPTGIAKFTLFKGKRPLNERLVFVDNKDQLSIKLTTNKPKYQKRDSVGVELTITNKNGMPVQGNFSVSVTDDMQVKADTVQNNSIVAGLLLNTDLKGHIEEPGYYIDRKNKQAWAALDVLLLTQGWTGYDWKDVFDRKVPQYKVEKDLAVTGTVVNLSNKPVPNTEVIISSQKPSFINSVTTDGNGRYSFTGLLRIDSGSFFLQANNKNGKARAFGSISVDKFRPLPIPETIKDAVLPWYVNSDTTQLNYVKRVGQQHDFTNMKGQGTMLRDVNIKNIKVIKGSFNRNGPGRQDLVFDEKDIKESAVMNLWQLLRQKLPGLAVTMEKGLPTLRLNKRLVVVLMDGGGLPLQLNFPMATADELVDEMSQFQVAKFKGMEVMWGDENTAKYLTPRSSWIKAQFKGLQMDSCVDSIKLGYDVQQWYFRSELRQTYLENRANLKTNVTPMIAIIDITTNNGSGWFRNPAPGATTYRPLPILYPQQFYSPKYKVNEKPVGMPDYRATLHWEPNIVTDANGKAKLYFYTSDLPTNYTFNIQGMTADGDIGGAVIKLPKEAKQAPQ